MALAEPMTALTDYALVAETALLGGLLVLRPQRSARLWGGALLALAVAAATGGTAHGFAPRLSPAAFRALWLATYYAIGLSNLLLAAGMLWAATRGPLRRALLGIALLRCLVYAAVLTAWLDFRYVIYDYVITLGGLLVLGVWLLRREAACGRYVIAALLLFAASAVVQRSVWELPPLNHNDLFHVVQMAGLFVLFLAGRRLPDA